MASIGLDLDGVCYNFIRAMNTFILERHPELAEHILDLDDDSEWSWYKKWGWVDDQFVLAMQSACASRKLWWKGDCYEPDLRESIQGLRKAGHTIHVVTNRGYIPRASDATHEWIYEHLGWVETITLAKSKTDVYHNYFVEDDLANYDALVHNGTRALLINRKYNQRDDNRYRYDTVADAAKYIHWREDGE